MRKASGIRRKEGDSSNIVAVRLKAARSLHLPPLTMEETAQRATVLSGYHISRDMVVRIENGHRSVYDYEVYALSLALDVDVRFLMGIIDDTGQARRLSETVKIEHL